MHTWQQKQIAFDPLVQLPEINDESYFSILLGSDKGLMAPLKIVNFLECASLAQMVALLLSLSGACHQGSVCLSTPWFGAFL